MALATANFKKASDVTKFALDQLIGFLKSEAFSRTIQVPWIFYPIQHIELLVAVTIMHMAQHNLRPQASQ